eukprot:m.770196 g.770196  ORF g.770196 m.770196 type:complete len:241 (+) comp59081_c1_seq10:425-1147(+)
MKPASMGSARQSSTTALESCKTSAKCSSTRLLSQSPLALMKITTKPIPTLYYLSLARLRLKVAPFTWRLELLACLFHSIGITSLMQSNDGAQALELLSTEQERQVIVKQTGLDASQRATFDAAVKTLAEIFDDDQEPADSDEKFASCVYSFDLRPPALFSDCLFNNCIQLLAALHGILDRREFSAEASGCHRSCKDLHRKCNTCSSSIIFGRVNHPSACLFFSSSVWYSINPDEWRGSRF